MSLLFILVTHSDVISAGMSSAHLGQVFQGYGTQQKVNKLCGGHGTLNDKYINKCIVQENSTEYMILSININKQFIFILFIYTCHNWFLQSQLRHVIHELYKTIVNECLLNVSSTPLMIPCVCSQKLINRNGGLFCLPGQIMSFPFRLIWV